MAVNKIKETPVEEKPVEKPKPQRKRPSILKLRLIRFMNMFGIFNRNQVVHNMPFILFLTLLVMGYIANSYYAERIIREIDKTKTDLKEKRAEYISTMSQLMYQSNQSELAKILQPYEIKESTEPPGKIFITEQKQK